MVVTWRPPLGSLRDGGSRDPAPCPPLSNCENLKPETFESVPVAPGYGLVARPGKGLGKGAQKLRKIGAAIAAEFPKENCAFFTGTLPGSSERAIRDFARVSSYVQHLFKAKIRKEFGYSPSSFYVWEHQRRGALHWHACFAMGSPWDALWLQAKSRDWWYECLLQAEENFGAELWERSDLKPWRKSRYEVLVTDCQIVEKDVGAYLAKYLEKDLPWFARTKAGNLYSPPRYWGATNSARKLARELSALETREIDSYSKAVKVGLAIAEKLVRSASWHISLANKWVEGWHSYIFRFKTIGEAVNAFVNSIDIADSLIENQEIYNHRIMCEPVGYDGILRPRTRYGYVNAVADYYVPALLAKNRDRPPP